MTAQVNDTATPRKHSTGLAQLNQLAKELFQILPPEALEEELFEILEMALASPDIMECKPGVPANMLFVVRSLIQYFKQVENLQKGGAL